MNSFDRPTQTPALTMNTQDFQASLPSQYAMGDARDILTKEMRDTDCRVIVAAAGGDNVAIATLIERGFAVSAEGSGDDNLRTVSHELEPRVELAAREMAEAFYAIAGADLPSHYARGAYESATARYAAAIAPETPHVLASCIKLWAPQKAHPARMAILRSAC